jgi:hypothetical protein
MNTLAIERAFSGEDELETQLGEGRVGIFARKSQ